MGFVSRRTRRAWEDKYLKEIRSFYRQFVEAADLRAGEAVGNLNRYKGAPLGRAGRLPLEKYFAATLTHHQALSTGEKTIDAVAREHRLNAKYLNTL